MPQMKKILSCNNNRELCEELDSPLKLSNVYQNLTWHIKYHISSLQRTHEHQTGQGADLPCKASTLKPKQSFYYVTNVRSRDYPKNVYLHLHKFYGFKLGSVRLLYSEMMFRTQMFKSSPTSCIISMTKIQNWSPLNDVLVQCIQNLNYSDFCEFDKRWLHSCRIPVMVGSLDDL